MKISIVTAAFNSASTIGATLQSVASQTHRDVEHIVVDGGSRDATLSVVDSYGDSVAKKVSEPDRGIYDAMNKGVAMATGDVIGILNSDDMLFSDTTLEEIASAFADESVDACYGDILYCDRSDVSKTTRFWKSGPYASWKLFFGWAPPHPSFYVRREAYEKYGAYREDLPIAADYELMLRMLKKHRVRARYLPTTVVRMREGGHSASGILQRLKGIAEVYRSWSVNGMMPPATLFMRVALKLPQFLAKSPRG